jgi:uncharacterized membrane protein
MSASPVLSQSPLSPRARKLAAAVDHLVDVVARRWLLTLCGWGTVATLLPIVAPMLRAASMDWLANPIYFSYSFICHQRSDRSFHIHGEQMAFCARDFAIFAGAVGIAAIYGLWRMRFDAHHMRVPAMLLMIAPLAIDGLTQLLGLRESTWELRVATGLLFSAGIGWFLLPRLEDGFTALRSDAHERGSVPAEQGSAAR